MFALYIWTSVLGGGMVLASLWSSISSHASADHGHDSDHGHDAGHGHDHDTAHDHDAGHDHDTGHDLATAADASAGHEASAEADGETGSDHDGDTDGDAHAEDAPAAGPNQGIVLAHKEAIGATSDMGVFAYLRFVRPASHFMTGFGVTGLLATLAGAADPLVGGVAAATGVATMLVGRQISKLRSHETTSAIGEDDLLGRQGEVIIRIGPGDVPGRIRVLIKGSAPDFVALPAKPEQTFEAGEKVYVIEQIGDGALRVDRRL